MALKYAADHRAQNIGIFSIPGNHSIADNYQKLIAKTVYAPQARREQCALDNLPALSKSLSLYEIALASIGLPGMKDYPEHLSGFMEGLAAARKPPVTAFITHDSELTEYIIKQWLEKNRNAQLSKDLLTIVDLRIPPTPEILAHTLDVLHTSSVELRTPQAEPLPNTEVSIKMLHSPHSPKKATP